MTATTTAIVPKALRTLDRDELRRAAPSVFATKPFPGLSDRYKFIPTIEVVDMVAEQGFLPVRAEESRAMTPDRVGFQRHMLRFRHRDFLGAAAVGDEFPELVVTNSHDGSAGYEFMVGILRLLCLNGMVASKGQGGGFKLWHKGGDDFYDQVIDTTYEVMGTAPTAIAQIDEWKQIALPAPEQARFARAAAIVRDLSPAEPMEMLRPRRYEDQIRPDGTLDLWTALNVVQENSMRGGVPIPTRAGRFRDSRPITSVDTDIHTNRNLWLMASRMALTLN